MGLIAELQRRNVIRMAGLYLVAAWLIVQVAGTLLPMFEAPAWLARSIVVVLALGFVPVLIFSWVYELTPEGFKRDAEVPPEQSVASLTGRRMDRMIIAVLLVALGYFALDKFVLAPRRTAVATQDQAAPARATEPPAANERSIAVLPFQNLSEDKGNQYFADGIAEELLNQLAKAPDLQVAGRTSSFAFRDKDQDLRGIAQQLGVAWLLEGSVRRSGNRVRITAQLIKAGTGFHAWSETYDRDLTDIFALQDEIAGAIAAALKLNLGAHQPVAQIPVAAYDTFLQGQALMASRRLDDLDAARTQFEEAIRLAPEYAPAYVSLARVNLLIPLWTAFSGRTPRINDLVAEAERLIERALVLDPNSATAHAALGTLRSSAQWRWEEAGKAFERALELAPGSAEIANFAGDYYRIVLDRERAFANERRALELDPMARYNLGDMVWVAVAFRDVPEAIRRAEAVRAVSPELFDPYIMLVWALGEAKRFPEMHKAIADARQRTSSEQNFMLLEMWAALAEDRRDDALALLAKLEPFAEQDTFSSADLGFGYLNVGESAKARRWLERALDHREYNLVYNEPLDLEQLARDPATRDLLERPGIKELREIRRRNGAIKE